jgi:hypothetical protein
MVMPLTLIPRSSAAKRVTARTSATETDPGDGAEEVLVETMLARDLRVEGRAEEIALFNGDAAAVGEGGQGSGARPDGFDDRGPDEHRMYRVGAEHGDVELGFERRRLRAEGVPANSDIEATDAFLAPDGVENDVGEHDQPGAGAIDGQPGRNPGAQRFGQAESAGHLVHHAGLAARNHETVDTVQLIRTANEFDIGAEGPKDLGMLPKITLEGENSNAHGRATTNRVRRGGAVRPGRTR